MKINRVRAEICGGAFPDSTASFGLRPQENGFARRTVAHGQVRGFNMPLVLGE